jgi:hypothetical protein
MDERNHSILKGAQVTAPSAGDDDNQPSPRRKPQDGTDWESTVPDEIMDAAAGAVVEQGSGCLFRVAVWLLKLPFRLALRIIEGLSD